MRLGIISIGVCFYWSLVSTGYAAQWMHSPSIQELLNKSLLKSFSASIQSPDRGTLLLGRGFNSVSNTAGGPCVEAGEVDTLKSQPNTGLGQKVAYSMQEVESMEDLQQLLDISLGGTLGLGVWNVDLKSQYYRNIVFNNNNYYLVLRVVVENQTEVLKNYKLTQAAQDLYMRDGEKAFLHACGDQFVAARITGGEFIAVVEIETRSWKEKQAISLRIGGNQIFDSANTDVGATLDELSRRYRTSVSIFRDGDNGPLPAKDPQQLIDYALNFPTKVQHRSGGEWPFLVATESYDAILDKPSRGLIHLDNQRKVVAELSRAHEGAKFTLNEIEYVLKNSDQFSPYDPAPLIEAQKTFWNILKTTQAATDDCISHLLEGCSMPALEWPADFRLPPRLPANLMPSHESSALPYLKSFFHLVLYGPVGYALNDLHFFRAFSRSPRPLEDH